MTRCQTRYLTLFPMTPKQTAVSPSTASLPSHICGSPLRDMEGLLLPIFPGYQEIRRFEAHTGPTCPEWLHCYTDSQLLESIQPDDWMSSLDLTNAYFPIFPCHRKYQCFAVGNQCYQYCRLPFGCSLAACTFSKCVEVALTPLQRRGLRTLTYINDWLILPASKQEVKAHKALIIQQMMHILHFAINPSKSTLQRRQHMSYLGLLLDSTP